MVPGQVRIRPAVMSDALGICDIYNHYVINDTCTFREEVETVAERERWLKAHESPQTVLVCENSGGDLVGWASLSRFKERSAYRYTAEDSIYLHPACRRQGIGSLLFTELMRHAEARYRTVIAAISADQPASIALHRRYGFQQVAHLREVGFKFGRWLDVVYLQIDLGMPAPR